MSDVAGLKQDILDLKGLVSNVAGDVDSLIAQVKALKEQIANGSPATQADLDALGAGLAELKASLTATDAKEPAPETPPNP